MFVFINREKVRRSRYHFCSMDSYHLQYSWVIEYFPMYIRHCDVNTTARPNQLKSFERWQMFYIPFVVRIFRCSHMKTHATFETNSKCTTHSIHFLWSQYVLFILVSFVRSFVRLEEKPATQTERKYIRFLIIPILIEAGCRSAHWTYVKLIDIVRGERFILRLLS